MAPARGSVAAALLLLVPAAAAGRPPLASGPWGARDPAAAEGATVVRGFARFTVLTERLIRMEFDPSAAFEDRATVAMINRRLPLVAFAQTDDGETLSIGDANCFFTCLPCG